jgi:hypothetical protein
MFFSDQIIFRYHLTTELHISVHVFETKKLENTISSLARPLFNHHSRELHTAHCLTKEACWKAVLAIFRTRHCKQSSAHKNLSENNRLSHGDKSRLSCLRKCSEAWTIACSSAFESLLTQLSNAPLQARIHVQEPLQESTAREVGWKEKHLQRCNDGFTSADACEKECARKPTSAAFQ